MVRIVIDIPDLTYESIMKYQSIKEIGADFIRQGTVLPKGEWIENSLTIEKTLNCSICGAKPRQSVYGYYLHDNFCSNCGADMRGDKE